MALIEFSNTGASSPVEKKEQKDKNIQKVVSGKASKKKRGFLNMLYEEFIQEDAETIREHLMEELAIKTKTFIWEMISSAIDARFWGGGDRRPGQTGNRSSASYQKYYRSSENRPVANPTRARSQTVEISVDDRFEAEKIVDTMVEIVSEYDMVSVADLYELAGLSSSPTDHKYGWTDISVARIERDGRKAVLIMPKPSVL